MPARPGERVVLEFLSEDGWTPEDSAVTDVHGQAVLRPYPLCEADRWCDATVRYRISAGGDTASLTITYDPH